VNIIGDEKASFDCPFLQFWNWLVLIWFYSRDGKWEKDSNIAPQYKSE